MFLEKLARVEEVSTGISHWVTERSGDLVALGEVSGTAPINEQAIQIIADGLSARTIDGAKRLDRQKIRWLTPVLRPGKILCLGLNFAAHAAEGGNVVPEYPSVFMRAASSLVAHNAPIVRPYVSEKLDFEAELAVVIGQHGRNLTLKNALHVVAAYSCFNDATLRDYQRRTSQWTIGKNFDGTGAFGPWLVPTSQVPAGAAGLRIQSRLNGQTMQNDNTSNMIVSVARAIVVLSEVMTLEPGDVIAMGTPAGVGYARNPPVWMKPDDQIEIDIEGIGILSNTVAQMQA